MDTPSERYASMVKLAAGITTKKPLTVSMVARAADVAGVEVSSWFPVMTRL